MKQKLQQVLQEMGLSNSESKIYIQLVRSAGVQPASTLAQRLRMNRTTVYKSLLKLVKMGLVTKTMKHGIICFFTENPKKEIEQALKLKEERLKLTNQFFLEALSDLKFLEKEQLSLPKVRVYEGLEGIKRVYEDTLLEGETIYAFENVDDMDPKVREFIMNSYVPRRTEKNLFAYVITPESQQNIVFRDNDENCARKTRFLPNMDFPVEVEVNIYGKKIAFFSYRNHDMFGVIIESNPISRSMKAVFNICWKMAK